ncbi:MAG: hypothetical protein ACPGJV_03920 [Bacteriovoracaceae bacterium]
MKWTHRRTFKLLSFIALTLLCESVFARSYQRSRVLMHDQEVDWSASWLKLGKTEGDSIKELFKLLRKSNTGTRILLKTRNKLDVEGRDILDLVSSAETSLTDTTLIRRFSPYNPLDVTYVTRSTITINRNHNVMDALLDLAHELTHFIYRAAFNPYEANFNWKQFIADTVEGRGGEVDAYLKECQVMKELRPRYYANGSKCLNVVDMRTGKLSKLLATREFYRVGNHLKRFHRRVKDLDLEAEDQNFPISGKESRFISSAYGLPYPVAALEEYAVIMNTVCQNDQKRLKMISRSPAVSDSEHQEYLLNFKSRCRSFVQ